MYPPIHIISLISIISLTLGYLTACGNKQPDVARGSGTPGQEVTLEPLEENLLSQTSELRNKSSDASALVPQVPETEGISTDPVGSAMSNDPINMVHEATDLPSEDGSSEIPDKDNAVSPLDEGKDFAAGRQDIFSGSGVEPIQEALQIAKADSSDRQQDQINRIKEGELKAAAVGLKDVFFQFDSWLITQEGQEALQHTLEWFERDTSSNLIIAGHADQRGTRAYNLVLAKRRAVAVQDYLSQFGIDDSRLAIISYGKDKPFCQDVTEECYQLNRRGHLLVHVP